MIEEIIVRTINQNFNKPILESISDSCESYYSNIEKDLETSRLCEIVKIATKSNDQYLIRYFIETVNLEDKNTLQIKDLYDEFILENSINNPRIGLKSRLISCNDGSYWFGIWKENTNNKNQLILEIEDLKLKIIYDKNKKQKNTPNNFILI